MPIYKIKGKKNEEGLQKYRVFVNYIDDEGRYARMTRVVTGNENAKDVERQLRVAINNREIEIELQAKKITVQQLFDEYIDIKQYEIREATLDKYKRNLRYYVLPNLGKIRVDKINVATIRDWKMSIEKRHLSITTRRNIFADLRALLNYAVSMEYTSINMLTKVGNFKDNTSTIKPEMDFYTPKEFSAFIKAAKEIAIEKQEKSNDMSEWDYYVFFSIAFYTGLRKGEIHALKWRDIDGAYLSVKRSITQKLKGEDRETLPKNKSSIRTIQMPLPLIKILEAQKWRQEQMSCQSADFRVCGIDRCLRDTTIQKRNVLYSETAGLRSIRIHDFRHSHVSVLANEGINIQEIARRLGHSKIEMTWNTYSHLYPREEEKAMNVLNTIA